MKALALFVVIAALALVWQWPFDLRPDRFPSAHDVRVEPRSTPNWWSE